MTTIRGRAEIATDAVVVGIDGSMSGRRAMLWAADRARQRRTPLVLVHGGDVGPPGAPSSAVAASAADDARSYGRELLADAVAVLAETHPELLVDTRLTKVDGATCLIDLSHRAGLLVVGRGDHHRTGLRPGSTGHRVLAHAGCPTVLISAKPAADPHPDGAIVVGVSNSPGGVLAMRFACEEAFRRGADARAVRSWCDHNWTLTHIESASPYDASLWRQEQEHELDRWLVRARAEYPDVALEAALSGLPVEQCLQEASADAALLVLGCRRGDSGLFPRLGPVASSLINHIDRPIAIIGHNA